MKDGSKRCWWLLLLVVVLRAIKTSLIAIGCYQNFGHHTSSA
jgi:hypothetical protein